MQVLMPEWSCQYSISGTTITLVDMQTLAPTTTSPVTFQAANLVLRLSWIVTVQRPQRSFPSLRMASERKNAHYQSPWDLLDPKPASVRALTSVLWTKHQSHRVPLLQFSNCQTNSSFPFSLTFPQTLGPPVTMNGSGSHSICIPKTTMRSGWSSCSR
jgi:hypothetical protein